MVLLFQSDKAETIFPEIAFPSGHQMKFFKPKCVQNLEGKSEVAAKKWSTSHSFLKDIAIEYNNVQK